MKKVWQTRTLGDVCSFENGDRGTNYPSRSAQTSHGIPFINAGHLTDGGIDTENLNFIPRERFNLLSNGKIRRGDILFCLRGSLGKFASVGSLSEGAIASSLVIVRPGDSVLAGYILAYFKSDLCTDMINRFKNGAAQPNLSALSLTKFAIPVPPLPEQQRIVGILDEAFEGIVTAKANAEKNLQNARALFQSHLQSVFADRGDGWPVKTLGELSDQITDGTHNSPPYVESGIPMLDSKHVKDGFMIDDTEPEKFISPATDALLAKRCKPRTGDILISSRGSIGKIAIVREGQDFNIMGNMILIRLPAGVSREFVAFYLHSQVSHIESIARGAAQKGLYLNQIRDYELPLPPQTKQVQIGKQLDSLSDETQRLASLYERKLAGLEALKKSLLHQAFTGQL